MVFSSNVLLFPVFLPAAVPSYESSAVTLCLHGSFLFPLPPFQPPSVFLFKPRTAAPIFIVFRWHKTGSKTLHVLCKIGSSINWAASLRLLLKACSLIDISIIMSPLLSFSFAATHSLSNKCFNVNLLLSFLPGLQWPWLCESCSGRAQVVSTAPLAHCESSGQPMSYLSLGVVSCRKVLCCSGAWPCSRFIMAPLSTFMSLYTAAGAKTFFFTTSSCLAPCYMKVFEWSLQGTHLDSFASKQASPTSPSA